MESTGIGLDTLCVRIINPEHLTIVLMVIVFIDSDLLPFKEKLIYADLKTKCNIASNILWVVFLKADSLTALSPLSIFRTN